MISKKGKARKKGKSSFSDIAKYATDNEKAEYISIVHCGTDSDINLAIAEIEATQALNTRSNRDKSLHVILSWRKGEHLSHDVIADIENHFANALGLSKHQRICGLHTDTDNLHLHMAFNLIDPETGHKISPWQDYLSRDRACREMELKHNLEVDNGLHHFNEAGELVKIKNKDKERIAISEGAKLIQSHRGVESFQTWVSKEPANALRAVMEKPDANWQDIHATLDQFNLRLAKRGNGLSIVDQDNSTLAAKASHVGRFFGIKTLQDRFGNFEPSTVEGIAQNKKQYVEQPSYAAISQRRESQAALYRSFTAEKSQRSVAKREAWALQRDGEKTATAALVASFSQKRIAIKDGAGTPLEKKTALKLLAMDRVLQEQRLREANAARRSQLKSEHGHLESYRQFVQRRAQEGDEAALSAMRGMKPDSQARDAAVEGNTIRSGTRKDHVDAIERGPLYKGQTITHQVHRNSDVSYLLNGRIALRDEGRIIRITDGKDASTIELGLRLAQKKFGDKITLTGDAEFKRLAVRTAVENGIRISFADPALEAMRVALNDERATATAAKKGRNHIAVSGPRAVEIVTFDVPFQERIEATDLGLKWSKNDRGYGAERGSEAAALASKRWPEKQSPVHIDEVLPIATVVDAVKVSAPLPIVGAESPAGAVTSPFFDRAAVDLFIAERNETPERVKGLYRHRLIEVGEDFGGKFVGFRNRPGQKIMLVEDTVKKEMLVVPITAEHEKAVYSTLKGGRIEGRFEAHGVKVKSPTPTKSRGR